MKYTLDDRERPIGPFLIFQMFDGDVGEHWARQTSIEYITRRPYCARYDGTEAVELQLSNIGEVSSDLVRVDYHLVLCTYDGHRPSEGFSVDHAREAFRDPIEAYETVTFVPSGGHSAIRIPLPDIPSEVRNIYFRARAFTLWEKRIPPSSWHPVFDPRVVEIHQAFP